MIIYLLFIYVKNYEHFSECQKTALVILLHGAVLLGALWNPLFLDLPSNENFLLSVRKWSPIFYIKKIFGDPSIDF